MNILHSQHSSHSPPLHLPPWRCLMAYSSRHAEVMSPAHAATVVEMWSKHLQRSTFPMNEIKKCS